MHFHRWTLATALEQDAWGYETAYLVGTCECGRVQRVRLGRTNEGTHS